MANKGNSSISLWLEGYGMVWIELLPFAKLPESAKYELSTVTDNNHDIDIYSDYNADFYGVMDYNPYA